MPLNIACPAMAQGKNVVSMDELASLESKLFHRTYENDPLSKRLQRLELLSFGATQYGNSSERWNRIKRTLQKKSNVAENIHQSGIAAQHHNEAASLNELEKYVFKKTSPGLTSSARLDKLEAKLFGKSSNNMPAEQRIARLEKTLGIASTPEQMAHVPGMLLPPTMRSFAIPPSINGQPGMSHMFSYGFNFDDTNDPDLSQFESQMSRMFNEMERQMQDQMREGTPSPKQPPNHGAPQIIIRPRSKPETAIPSYSDPNFI